MSTSPDPLDSSQKSKSGFNLNLVKAKINKSVRAQLAGGKSPRGPIQGTGSANRHGMPKLPPGQSAVPNWPVLDLGVKPEIQHKDWYLEVKGAVKNPFRLNWKEFLALPQIEDVSDFHCVTTWSRMDNRWQGVLFKTLSQKAGPEDGAAFVYITGYDGYSTNLKLSECLDDDVLLVHTWEGAPLPTEHGGPVRMITPRKYAWKGSKWIKEIIFLKEEKLGFWELRGYSNSAEPWDEDRYAEPAIGG